MNIENLPNTYEPIRPRSPESGHGVLLGQCIDPNRPLLYLSEELAQGSLRTPHEHPRGQLAWAASGVLRVNTGSGSWVVPPSHAVWITGGERHEILVANRAAIRYLFVDPSVLDRLPDHCQVMAVTPLFRELLLRLLSYDLEQPQTAAQQRLVQVLLDELAALQPSPLYLPSGQDRRLLMVMQQLARNPADTRTLPELATLAGASSRTLERLFQAETGLGFQQWRSRLRLLEAVQRLNRGESSASVALSLGYASSSAFVAAFRRYFGQPPQSFGGA